MPFHTLCIHRPYWRLNQGLQRDSQESSGTELDQLQHFLRFAFHSEIGHAPWMRLTWHSVPTHLFLGREWEGREAGRRGRGVCDVSLTVLRDLCRASLLLRIFPVLCLLCPGFFLSSLPPSGTQSPTCLSSSVYQF